MTIRPTPTPPAAALPPQRPATLANLVPCARGQADPDRYTWSGLVPLFHRV